MKPCIGTHVGARKCRWNASHRTPPVLVLLFVFILSFFPSTLAWSNGGGPSDDPAHPSYGTHDWIAEHALDFLPEKEKQWLLDYKADYLYGTELPDFQKSTTYPDGVGDQMKHHVYFNADGSVMDDSSAKRAQEEYDTTVELLKEGNMEEAAKHAGMMTHYMADVAVFGHVMGYYTSWMNTRASDHGSEGYWNHYTYEKYVDNTTRSYNSTEWNRYLKFDGKLSNETAYQLTIKIAYNTTFNPGSYKTCVWIDNYLYDHQNETERWSNKTFHDRTGELLNLAVNAIADTLHKLYSDACMHIEKADAGPPTTSNQNPYLLGIIPSGIAVASIFYVWFRYVFPVNKNRHQR